jgi:HEPN domain-containing protein
MATEDFASLVSRRTPFADAILNSKQLLYQNSTKAEWESGHVNEGGEPTNIDIELARWYKRAITFWEIAGTQFRFGEYGMAAFCIHQAAEQFMCMLIQASIGYRVGTHNLGRLLRLLHFYVPEIDNVFSRETALEKEQFLLLKSTYIHFRYHPNYNISEEDVRYFIREVEKLQGIAERIFYSKTSILQSGSRLQGVS